MKIQSNDQAEQDHLGEDLKDDGMGSTIRKIALIAVGMVVGTIVVIVIVLFLFHMGFSKIAELF